MKKLKYFYLCLILLTGTLVSGFGETIKTGPLLFIKDGKGLNVFVDGELKGKTPLLLSDLREKNKTVLLESEIYRTEIPIIVENARTGITTYAPVLKKHTGTLTIDVPQGKAKVFLNGIEAGFTPFSSKDYEAKDYHLRLELEGYFPLEKNITLLKKSITDVKVEMEKIYTLTFTPPLGEKDRVIFTRNERTIDYKGTTSLTIPEGEWNLTIKGEDFAPVIKDLIITEDMEISYTPQFYEPKLTIENIHPKALVFLDGEDITIKAAAGPIDITKGSHNLLVQRKKYMDYKQTLIISPEKDTVVNVSYLVDMEIAEASRSNTKTALIIGGIAAIGGGVYLNFDDTAINLTSDYAGYKAIKYSSLGITGGGIISLITGLMMTAKKGA